MKFDNVVIFSIETTRRNNVEIVESTKALAAKNRRKGRRVDVVTLLKKGSSSNSKLKRSYDRGHVDLQADPRVGVYINGHHGTYHDGTPDEIHNYLSELRGDTDYVIGRINVVMCRFIDPGEAPQQILDEEQEVKSAIHMLAFSLRQYGQTPTLVVYAKPIWVYNEHTFKAHLENGIVAPSYMKTFNEDNVGRKFWMNPLTKFVKNDREKGQYKLSWTYFEGVGYRIDNANLEEIPDMDQIPMPNLNRYVAPRRVEEPMEIITLYQPIQNNPSWQPDNAVTQCPQCHRDFTFFTRRHHCRKCGLVVCNQCSGNRQLVQRPASSSGAMLAVSDGEVRVCDACVNG